MQELIRDILEYSRVGHKGNEFKPAESPLRPDKALLNLKVTIEESGAEVTYDGLPTVMADGIQLVSLFQNLSAMRSSFAELNLRGFSFR